MRKVLSKIALRILITIFVVALVVFAVSLWSIGWQMGDLGTAKVEAATTSEQNPARFQFQGHGQWNFAGLTYNGGSSVYYNVAAVCDTANGNLLYLQGDSRSSPTVVLGGCQKSPR